MPVKIRLARRGRKKAAIYDIVVSDSRSPRDGRFIEKLGQYNPNTNPATIKFDTQKAFEWVMKGAQPTDTVKGMLSAEGILFQKHLQVGVNKGAITQEQADSRLEDWKSEKQAKVAGQQEQLGQKKADVKRAALEAETKVKEARAEKIRQRDADLAKANAPQEEPAAEAEPATEAAAEAPAAEGAAEAPAEEQA